MIWLMLSVSLCPKVITLNAFYCSTVYCGWSLFIEALFGNHYIVLLLYVMRPASSCSDQMRLSSRFEFQTPGLVQSSGPEKRGRERKWRERQTEL